MSEKVTAIATIQPSRGLEFTQEQRQMIRDSLANGASEEEFAMLMEVARSRNLNPLMRQIFFVKRWDSIKKREVWSHQTSIDGLRAIAERTGKYEGQAAPLWCGKEGIWVDVWLSAEPPAAARVGVYKTGFREATWAVARWESYVQKTKEGKANSMWGKMADLMLAKCAEALALRKAFPEDMSGLYTAEEMAQADNGRPSLPESTGDNLEEKLKQSVALLEEQKKAKQRAAQLAEQAEILEGEVVDGEVYSMPFASKQGRWDKGAPITSLTDGDLKGLAEWKGAKEDLRVAVNAEIERRASGDEEP